MRPKWAEAIREFITDDVIDPKYDWPGDDSADGILDRIEVAVLDILCDEFGHEIIDDHCGIPEHRYCVYCRTSETAIARREAGD